MKNKNSAAYTVKLVCSDGAILVDESFGGLPDALEYFHAFGPGYEGTDATLNRHTVH